MSIGIKDSNPAEVANKNATLELASLKNKYDALKAEFDSLQKVHIELAKVVDSENRAKLMKVLGAETRLTVEEMEKLPTSELMDLVETARILKSPHISLKPVGDEAEVPSTLTVPSKFRFGPKVI